MNGIEIVNVSIEKYLPESYNSKVFWLVISIISAIIAISAICYFFFRKEDGLCCISKGYKTLPIGLKSLSCLFIVAVFNVCLFAYDIVSYQKKAEQDAKISYTVTINESVPFLTVYSNYDIVKQEGKLYTLIVKDGKTDLLLEKARHDFVIPEQFLTEEAE